MPVSWLTCPCPCVVCVCRLSSTDDVLATLRAQVARVQSEEEVRRVQDGELEQQKERVLAEIKANKLAAPMGPMASGGGEAAEGRTRKDKKRSGTRTASSATYHVHTGISVRVADFCAAAVLTP